MQYNSNEGYYSTEYKKDQAGWNLIQDNVAFLLVSL